MHLSLESTLNAKPVDSLPPPPPPPPLPTDENMEEDDLEAADSGVGPSLRPSSSGRLSSLSHYSDGTIIQIPGERSVHVFSSIVYLYY